MIVVFSDASAINLDNVVMIDPRGFCGEVAFHSDTSEFIAQITKQEYQDMLNAWSRGDKIFSLYDERAEHKEHGSVDFSDFPSVLEGENSPSFYK